MDSEDQYAVSIKEDRRIRACTHQRPQKIKINTLIDILKTNTPYPSRKIRRIGACTHQRPLRNKDQYAENSLIELRFKVQKLLRIIESPPTSNCEFKGVTNRGGKTTTQDGQKDDTNINGEKPLEEARDKLVESNEVIMENQPQGTNAPIIKQLHVNIPFIKALIQMPKYAKYLKSLLKNKSRLEAACMVTMNERCKAILLNELTSKEKDSTSIWRIDLVNTPYSEMKPELEKISKEEKSSLLQVLKKLKEAEYLATYPLSRFENPHMEVLTERKIADKFFDDHLMVLKSKFKDDEPWYAYFVNYIVRKVVPLNWTFEKRKRFFLQVKTYFMEEPYAFKVCTDNIMRRCVAGSETFKILVHCHSGPIGGHHSANITAKKVYESGFYWPSVFKDANEGNKYILVAVDYVSKLVEAQALPMNDARVVVKFLRSLFARYGVTDKLSTTYHPQSNGKTEVTNRAIKRILERSVGYNPKGWSEKLNDALWAFRTAYKIPTGCTPFKLVYRKACHLPVEIEHKAHWALKQCNLDLTLASKSRLMQLNELAELRDDAYENTRIYKERKKKWHDSRLHGDKDFKVGGQVLLYNSRMKMYPGKLKSKWSGPNIVKTVRKDEVKDWRMMQLEAEGESNLKPHALSQTKCLPVRQSDEFYLLSLSSQTVYTAYPNPMDTVY
ncbi:reverse transcriptase domain-containing protein [Tanacetum coccineum]